MTILHLKNSQYTQCRKIFFARTLSFDKLVIAVQKSFDGGERQRWDEEENVEPWTHHLDDEENGE